MAPKTRSTKANVAEKLERMRREPHRFGFFSALRFLECVHEDKPRLGQGAKPGDEPVRLGQEPSLSFAASTLASFSPGRSGRAHRLDSYFLGLFGPHGPLPLHLTEYARERERSYKDATFRRFADIFHHRMLAFFFRAWADAQPTVALDRPQDSHFDEYAGALIGIAGEGFQDRDCLHDNFKRHWTGRLSQGSRPAESLPLMLAGYFDMPFSLREFVGEWLILAPRDHLRLGQSPNSAVLGRSAVLGQSVWSCQHRFQLRCGPLTLDQFRDLLPGQSGLAHLADIVRSYLGDEFAWDCNLILKEAEVPAWSLGQEGQLGWTTWLGKRTTADDATDVSIMPDAFRGSGITKNSNAA